MRVLTILLVAMAVCALFPYTHAGSEKIEVVSTLQIFSSIVKQIGGLYVHSTFIVPSGTDIHDYSLTSEDMHKIERATLVVLASSEFFSVDRNIKEAAKSKRILDFQNYNATLLPLGDMKKCVHGYWLYTKNAIGIARAIYNTLSTLDPTHTDYFFQNYREFLKELNNSLSLSIQMIHDSGVYGKGVLLTVPGVFYIAKELGMNIRGVLVEGPNQFASSEDITKYRKEMETGDITMILNVKNLESSSAGRMAVELSKETGVPVVYLNIFSTTNYTRLILENAGAISSSNSVKHYYEGEGNCWPYIYTITILAATSAILLVIALSYRRELLK